MPIEVIMPKMGLNVKEGILVEWLVEDGQYVHKGQPIYLVETDKIANEIEAESDGVLRHVAQAGDSIPILGLVGYLLAEGEEMPARQGAAEEGEATQGPGSHEVKPKPAKRVAATPAAKRRAKELGVDIDEVAGSGRDGRIGVDDVERFAAQREAASVSSAAQVSATPVAKRLAKELGIDLSTITPGTPGGRIGKADVEKAAERALSDLAAGAVEEVTPLSGVRAVIAERMQVSSQQTAAVTLSTEVDATNLVRARTQINERLQGLEGAAVSYNAILVKIVAIALSEFPYMNTSLVEGAIHRRKEINIGVAVDSERGLLVPVVPNADSKPIVQINHELGQLVERALGATSRLDDLRGGTFTITNMGSLGIDVFTPIINYPEAAILGVGRIVPKVVVVDGGIYIRDRVVLSLTFDHRLIDGAPAARFLRRIAELIETLSADSELW